MCCCCSIAGIVVQICLEWIRLRDLLSHLRIGVTDLGQGGMPLLVVHRGRSKHYALLWLVEGEVGARDLLKLMLQGGPRHRQVHPRWWIWHSISRIIRCMSRRKIRRIILRSLGLTSISLMRIGSINMRIIMSSLILRSLSSRMILRSRTNGYAGGPSDLTLLHRFGGHVACRIWVDADVSIF